MELGSHGLRELGSHGPRDSATLHFTDILSPRMIQPGSREPRCQRPLGTREPRTKGGGEPWTHGIQKHCISLTFCHQEWCSKGSTSHGPRESETLHYSDVLSARRMEVSGRDPGNQRLCITVTFCLQEGCCLGSREPWTQGAMEPWTQRFKDPAFQSRSVDKDYVASEPGSHGPWDPSTPGVMVSGSHGPSYPETLSFNDVLSPRMM
jgi:hypothetical protein